MVSDKFDLSLFTYHFSLIPETKCYGLFTAEVGFTSLLTFFTSPFLLSGDLTGEPVGDAVGDTAGLATGLAVATGVGDAGVGFGASGVVHPLNRAVETARIDDKTNSDLLIVFSCARLIRGG